MAMRVLQVEPVGGHRGMHYYDFRLCNALVEQGVHPMLLTSDETDPQDAVRHFPLERIFQGIYGRGGTLRRGFRYARALLEIARRSPHPDGEIAQFHYFLIPPLDYLCLWLMRRKGFKIVITAHDVVPFNRQASRLLRVLYGMADHIVAHAQASKDELISLFGVPSERISVIPFGSFVGYDNDTLDEKQAKARLGLSAEQKMVLFFGQIKQVKGLDYLIQAFPAVLRTHPQAVLCIAGAVWKDDWGRYGRLIEELGLQDKVITRIEHISDQDVAIYFRAADVVALPYLKIYQSAVLLMAYAYGRPVVATATGGIVEVVREGETAYLVPPGDVARLAQAISQVLADKPRAEWMGQQAKRLAETEYSWTNVASRLKRIYEDISRF